MVKSKTLNFSRPEILNILKSGEGRKARKKENKEDKKIDSKSKSGLEMIAQATQLLGSLGVDGDNPITKLFTDHIQDNLKFKNNKRK